MKILVIQSDKGYVCRPETTKELESKIIRDRRFSKEEITFVRLPKELYEAGYDIYQGDISFSWTTKAINGGLTDLMKTVDYIVVDRTYNHWIEDNQVLFAIHNADMRDKLLAYDKRQKGFVAV